MKKPVTRGKIRKPKKPRAKTWPKIDNNIQLKIRMLNSAPMDMSIKINDEMFLRYICFILKNTNRKNRSDLPENMSPITDDYVHLLKRRIRNTGLRLQYAIDLLQVRLAEKVLGGPVKSGKKS